MSRQAELKQINQKVLAIKEELSKVGNMRPGTINEQFKDPESQSGSYYQLNYTYKMKTHTEYIRKANLELLESEVAEYQKFRKLVDDWISLSIKASKLRIKRKNQEGQ